MTTRSMLSLRNRFPITEIEVNTLVAVRAAGERPKYAAVLATEPDNVRIFERLESMLLVVASREVPVRVPGDDGRSVVVNCKKYAITGRGRRLLAQYFR